MDFKELTDNYLEDYCNKFVNENITKPIFEFSEEQLKEFLRDYLSEMGYSKDRAEVILSITTDGANVDLDKYLKDYENNAFAAKLAEFDIINKLDIVTDIYEKGEKVGEFISNGIDMSSYSTEEELMFPKFLPPSPVPSYS